MRAIPLYGHWMKEEAALAKDRRRDKGCKHKEGTANRPCRTLCDACDREHENVKKNMEL